jgi:hypothetical protein
MRKKNIVKATMVGAALALVIPGIAYAATTATAYTPGSTNFANQVAGALLKTDVQCGSGNVSGGGVITSDVNNTHAMETEPSPDGTNPATGTTTNPTYWLGYAGVGGQGGTFDVQPFAVCFTNTAITGTQVAVNTVAGPSGTDVMKTATATCPANTTLLGGGAKSKLASNKSDKIIGDYPSNSSGNAVADGATNPTSWSAVALNGGMGSTGNQTTAFAICSSNTNTGRTVTVKHTHATGPNGPSNSATATTGTCGTSGNMISGGGSISGSDPTTGSFTAPGSQGDHMTGLYPSGSTGTANTNNTATTNWTARGHTGGMTSPTTFTDVWGLCMN